LNVAYKSLSELAEFNGLGEFSAFDELEAAVDASGRISPTLQLIKLYNSLNYL